MNKIVWSLKDIENLTVEGLKTYPRESREVLYNKLDTLINGTITRDNKLHSQIDQRWHMTEEQVERDAIHRRELRAELIRLNQEEK
ncbi:hypothetical protein [Listeria booriae]|uniref:Uncharacterized protein n=1 Tax=Listeria booriae TaxID=1552123 RepID=A0A841ZUX3_9LIST|nr:hypothetical protein [Listeria booriae]MBC1564170.1 hypothetical protein [Listeria booriae]